MSQPYVGEIRIFAGNFAPAGWNFCDGSIIAIEENETLFNLIGTTYGGDGQSTFQLPDLRGRMPIHQGNGFTLAETGGTETVTLTVQQIPSHQHGPWAVSGPGKQPSPANGVWASSGLASFAAPGSVPDGIAVPSQSAGGSQPHDNFKPYLCMNYIISLFGIYPLQ